MDNFMISFIILIVAIFFSRMIIEKANKKLNQEKKAALIDVFSRDRIWTYGMLLGLIILFFITLRFSLIDPLWAYLIYIFLLISYVIMMAYYSYKKLKTNDFPSFYIKSYVLSLSIRLIGLLIFIALLNV
jgi:divalent metal cation (Fe/Co/Zn/Cd) transporter